MIRTINVSGTGRRHAARRRPPVPDREPLHRRGRQAAGHARRTRLHYGVSETLHGDPRRRRGRPGGRPGDYLYMNGARPAVPPGRVGHPARAPARTHRRRSSRCPATPRRATGPALPDADRQGRRPRRRRRATRARRARRRRRSPSAPSTCRRRASAGHAGGLRPDRDAAGACTAGTLNARAARAARGGRATASRSRSRTSGRRPRPRSTCQQAPADVRVVGRRRGLQPGADDRRRARRASTASTPTRSKLGSARDHRLRRASETGEARALRRGRRGAAGRDVQRPGDRRPEGRRQPGRACRRRASRATATSPCCSRTTTRGSAAAPDAVSDGGRGGGTEINYRNAGARARRRDDVQLRRQRRPGHAADPGLRGRPRSRSTRSGRPGSEQGHNLSLGGLSWQIDDRIPHTTRNRSVTRTVAVATGDHRRDRRGVRRRAQPQGRRHVLRRPPAPVHGRRHVGPAAGLPTPQADLKPLGSRAADRARRRAGAAADAGARTARARADMGHPPGPPGRPALVSVSSG